jgi:hypothetical protein
MGMGMRVNPYSPVYMGDPIKLFLCRRYEYMVVISDSYLPIVISRGGGGGGPPPPAEKLSDG